MLGAPRSGTTLLASALGAHPAVALLLGERRGGIFRIAGGKIPAVKLCTPTDVDLDRHWQPIYHLFAGHVFGKIGWINRNFDHRMPRSRLSLRDLAKRIELQALCLIREPTASIASLRRRENRTETAAREILRRTYRIYEKLPDEPRVKHRILSFDRLVSDPEAQLRGVCDWLGLPFDRAMLEAPRLNPIYPESGFRAEKATTAPEPADVRPDDDLAALRARYDALLARAP